MNSPQAICSEASPELCDNLLQFFLINKTVTTRTLIPTPASDPSDTAPCQAVFEKFEPVTLSIFEDAVGHIKSSVSHVPLKKKDAFSLKPLLGCLEDIKAWMALNLLSFNEGKKEVMGFSPNGSGPALSL